MFNFEQSVVVLFSFVRFESHDKRMNQKGRLTPSQRKTSRLCQWYHADRMCRDWISYIVVLTDGAILKLFNAYLHILKQCKSEFLPRRIPKMTDASACGNFNVIPGISFFTAAASAILSLSTTISHLLILHAIITDRKKKFKLFFYKLLFNISVADLLCGLFNDPYSVIFHTQEALHHQPIDIRVFHVSLYLLGSVPLFTMVTLSIDRILSLLKTSTYRDGFQGTKSWLSIAAVWFLSVLQILAYFKLGFIPYLVVFAVVNIALAVIAMLITYFIYRRYLGRNVNKAKSTPNANSSDSPSKRRQRREKRATRTFLITTVVIAVSYLPTCFATGYMNSCTNCNCAIVHSLRDIAIVSILAGPLFRAVNFLVCLKSLRTGFRLLRKDNRPPDSSQASSDQPKNANTPKAQEKESISEMQRK